MYTNAKEALESEPKRVIVGGSVCGVCVSNAKRFPLGHCGLGASSEKETGGQREKRLDQR